MTKDDTLDSLSYSTLASSPLAVLASLARPVVPNQRTMSALSGATTQILVSAYLERESLLFELQLSCVHLTSQERGKKLPTCFKNGLQVSILVQAMLGQTDRKSTRQHEVRFEVCFRENTHNQEV